MTRALSSSVRWRSVFPATAASPACRERACTGAAARSASSGRLLDQFAEHLLGLLVLFPFAEHIHQKPAKCPLGVDLGLRLDERDARLEVARGGQQEVLRLNAARSTRVARLRPRWSRCGHAWSESLPAAFRSQPRRASGRSGRRLAGVLFARSMALLAGSPSPHRICFSLMSG